MTARTDRTRRTLALMAKLALATAILALLVVEIQRQAGFARLVDEPKQWRMLAAALACVMLGVALSFVRWHIMVRALGLRFRLLETMRLGALGFALNFVSLGSVGGDVFKAVFLAKDAPGRRTEAVATVIADRVMGLVVMLVMATIASLLIDWSHAPVAVRMLVQTIRLAAAAALVAATLVLLLPALSGARVRETLARMPLVGATAARLVGAVQAYRNATRYLLLAGGICVIVDVLVITSFYFVGRGLPVEPPSWVAHFVIVPVASLAGAIPATPSGLGTTEAAVEAMYRSVPGQSLVRPGDGTLVALGQRLASVLVALVGIGFYLLQRGDLRQVIHDVEEAAEAADAL